MPAAGGAAGTKSSIACANASAGLLLRRSAECTLVGDGGARHDDGGRARRQEVRVIFRIREEGEVARLRVLDAGHALDVNVAVAFQTATQACGDIS